MKTRNKLERRINESYKTYKKYYKEAVAKGYSMNSPMYTKKEYDVVYKRNMDSHFKNVNRLMIQRQRTFIKSKEDRLFEAVNTQFDTLFPGESKSDFMKDLLKKSTDLSYTYRDPKTGKITIEYAHTRRQAIYMELIYLGFEPTSKDGGSY